MPGTLNNHLLVDVWWNNHFLCRDLESSNWNSQKKLVVWSSRCVPFVVQTYNIIAASGVMKKITNPKKCIGLEKQIPHKMTIHKFDPSQMGPSYLMTPWRFLATIALAELQWHLTNILCQELQWFLDFDLGEMNISSNKKIHVINPWKLTYMDVSENSDTPKSSISIGFYIMNHPFLGTPIFGNTHISPKKGTISK